MRDEKVWQSGYDAGLAGKVRDVNESLVLSMLTKDQVAIWLGGYDRGAQAKRAENVRDRLRN